MVLKVAGEWTQDWMRLAVRAQGLEEAVVEAGDGHANGSDRLLGGVFRAGCVVLLPLIELFEFAEGFGFFGFGGFAGIKYRFEFFLFFVQGAHGLAVVEGEAAFLEAGMAFEDDGCARGGVGDFGQAELLAVDLRDFGHEIDGVDGGFIRMVEEPGDVEEAALVFDVGFLAIED